MSIFITSDYHFSHPNITGPSISRWKSGYRDFESIHEMNKTLTDTTNKYVKEDDTLYFLGDWCFGGHIKTPTYRNNLNCKTIHLIRGNHDKRIDLYKDSFTSINNDLRLYHEGYKFYLSHYPKHNPPFWFGRDDGYIHLYGHCHSNLPDFEKSMDCGVDVAYKLYKEYRPFHIDEIIEIMNKR